jgi:hypothetical protein
VRCTYACGTDYADLRIMPITARKLASWAVTVALGSA